MIIPLIKPLQNAVIPLLTKQHKAFLASTRGSDNGTLPIDWLNLERQGEDGSFPQPLAFAWEYAGPVRLYLSLSEDFAGCSIYHSASGSVLLENLFIGRTYYWKVVSENGVSSEVRRFTTESIPPRWIHAGGLTNIRDIGGFSVPGGLVRQGMVFRGSEMESHVEITEHGKDVLLNTLHIKTDLDLRGEAVGKVSQSALGEPVNWTLIPVRAYDEFLLPEEKETCRKIFKLFTNRENYPFYIHCWGGADRTGTMILLLCAILGVAEKDLFADYELTSFSIWGPRSISSDLFVAFLRALDAYGEKTDSINKKCEAFLLSTGLTQEDLNEIRNIIIEKKA